MSTHTLLQDARGAAALGRHGRLKFGQGREVSFPIRAYHVVTNIDAGYYSPQVVCDFRSGNIV